VAQHLPLKLARVYEQLLKCNSSGSRGGNFDCNSLHDGKEYEVNRSISLRCWFDHDLCGEIFRTALMPMDM
jgi:hypothetical protein